MNILVKNATILGTGGKRNDKIYDLHIANGVIKKIGKKISIDKARIVEAKGCYIAPGFFDIGTQIGEPGFEHRETISSISRAAAMGGYTGIAPFPNTNPAVDHASNVAFILNASEKELPDFYPIGSISQNNEGKELAELIDMSESGAVAFSDGIRPIQSSQLLYLGLEYVKAINSIIINLPYEKSILTDPQIHEGKISTSLGLNGIPTISETIMLHRDISLQNYSNSKLLSYGISSAEAVKMIRAQKKKSEQFFTSVPILNLIFDEQSLAGFDSNLKTIPPLRESKDKTALRRAVKDQVIDCISSNHIGLEDELKSKSFAYAEFGAATIEACFSLANEVIDPDQLVQAMSIRPRQILGIELPLIKEGEKANLVLFNTEEQWVFGERDKASLSKNYPIWDRTMQGRVKATINGKQVYLDEK